LISVYLLIIGVEDYYCPCSLTMKNSILGRTPLDEGSVLRRDLYLTTHNTQVREASVPPAGFEAANPASCGRSYTS